MAKTLSPCCGEAIKQIAGLPTCPKCGTRLRVNYLHQPAVTSEERYSREFNRGREIGDPPGKRRPLTGED